MTTLRGKDVEAAIPADVRIVGIRWLNDAEDVAIDLEFPGDSMRRLTGTLLCAWAHDLRIDMNLEGRLGTVPAWEHAVSKIDEGWRVVFDIQPGLVSLRCNEVTLSIAAPGPLVG